MSLRRLLFPVAVALAGIVHAQPRATRGDSMFARRQLEKAELLVTVAAYDSATTMMQALISDAQARGFTWARIYGYDQLAEICLRNGKMAQMKRYDSLILAFAQQTRDTTLLIACWNRAGVYNTEQGKLKDAERNFQQALDLGLEKKRSGKTAEVYSNMASVYLASGEKEKAIDWFFKALRLYEEVDNAAGLGETYSNISSVYYLMGRVPDAIVYQKTGIGYRERGNDWSGLAIANLNISQLYILRDSFPLAYQHLKRAVQYADQINNPRIQGSAYSGMAAYYTRTKDFPTALQWQAKAIRLLEETDSKPLLSRLYAAAGNLANIMKDSVTALGYYNKALNLAIDLNNKENIGNAYQMLSNFYIGHNDFEKGYRFYNKYITYRDSIAATSTLARIEEVRTKYETEKKDNEIARLNTEQRIRQLEIEKQQAIIDGNNAEALRKENEIRLLSQQRELQEAAFQKQEEELEKQGLLAKNSEQELKLSNQEKQLRERELKAQKQLRNVVIAGAALLVILGLILFNRYKLKRKLEQQAQLLTIRNDISRNLHDDIGASLSNINILNELTRRNLHDPEKAASYLAKAGDDIQRISESLSDIVWNINPQYDDLDNLFVRMRRYAADMFDGRNIQAELLFPPDAEKLSMQMAQRRDFYLVFKEAVNNLVKYSRATMAKVEVRYEGNEVMLAVTDNGKGFDIANPQSGNGLQNMRQRAEKWNGQLQVESTPGKGSTVTLTMKVTV